MLVHLAVRNLGLIKEAALVPASGFTVITGETGAGKTLLLGAIRLLLGENADSSVVGPDGDTAIAEGVLLADQDEIPVSRMVPGEGRSRAYRDGVIVSAQALRSEVEPLIQIIGQHDQLELRKPGYVLNLLDRNLDQDGQILLDSYKDLWDRLARLRDEQTMLGGSRLELARELDLARYQHQEIARAGFAPGEDVTLEQTAMRLRNLEEIKDHLSSSDRVLDALVEQAGELVSYLRKAAALDSGAQTASDNAETLAISASELSRDLQSLIAGLESDPGSVTEVDRRLTLLGDLKMKYGKTLYEITAYGRAAAERADEVSALLDRAGSIDDEVDRVTSELDVLAVELSESRKKTADRLSTAIQGHLADVGLGGAVVRFDFTAKEPDHSGRDRVELTFASHDGLRAGPISKVASGGELSRLILAVSLASGTGAKQTLVFDEVDSGVGGSTALAVGRKLADLAHAQQVLCVTHLPQVAAFAAKHYVITRQGSVATVAQVVGDERLEEISRMMAGLPASDRGQDAAAELLELGQS